jgi:hypothetical protein
MKEETFSRKPIIAIVLIRVAEDGEHVQADLEVIDLSVNPASIAGALMVTANSVELMIPEANRAAFRAELLDGLAAQPIPPEGKN